MERHSVGKRIILKDMLKKQGLSVIIRIKWARTGFGFLNTVMDLRIP
jgi:hypothetical protein